MPIATCSLIEDFRRQNEKAGRLHRILVTKQLYNNDLYQDRKITELLHLVLCSFVFSIFAK